MVNGTGISEARRTRIYITLFFIFILGKNVAVLRDTKPLILPFITPRILGKRYTPVVKTTYQQWQICRLERGDSRFQQNWWQPERVQFLSLEDSRYRILYSPLRKLHGDGIGHGFTIMNAEIGAALRYKLFYTHRKGLYGVLTSKDSESIENFFGWGAGNVDREFVKMNFCKKTKKTRLRQCQRCIKEPNSSIQNEYRFNNIVEIPESFTYRSFSRKLGDEFWSNTSDEASAQDFFDKHNSSFTIFQMSTNSCNRAPRDDVVDRNSSSILFHYYWDVHGNKSLCNFPLEKLPSANKEQNKKEILSLANSYKLKTPKSNRNIQFSEDNVIIAIHARRGDFFEVKRQMVPCRTFATVIAHMMKVIYLEGGPFSKMPIQVHVYSEGNALNHSVNNGGHDISKLDKTFRDADGKIVTDTWFRELILEETNNLGAKIKEKIKSMRLEVIFHISSDTLNALHEMIAADVFLGSDSQMSSYIVSTLSRAAIKFLPKGSIRNTNTCCTVDFNNSMSHPFNMLEAKGMWRTYSNSVSASLNR